MPYGMNRVFRREDEDNLVVGKVYKYNNDLIVAMFDSPALVLHEWAETDSEVSHSVWGADKNSNN